MYVKVRGGGGEGSSFRSDFIYNMQSSACLGTHNPYLSSKILQT